MLLKFKQSGWLTALSVLGASTAWGADSNAAATVMATDPGTLKKILDWIMEATVKYSFQVLGGIVVLVVGWIIAGFLTKFVAEFLRKHKVDVTVSKFAVGAVKLIVMLFAVMAALSKFGIEIAPFIAGLSVVGFGTSFALQGPLSNYAAGITLIFTKPFKVGDIIEVVNVHGEVEDMTLARTLLRTVDGDTIVVPNKHIIGEIIHNYSDASRVDITVGISYSADVEAAIRVIKEVVKSDDRILKTREPKIGLNEFGDSSVNLFIRLWSKQADYYDVKFAINRKIFEALKKNKIEIPFPQRDVHIIERKNA
jgi:small conductance mechanosensitive channel